MDGVAIMNEVPRISAQLSEEARSGLDDFCSNYGVSLTGVLEAAGLIIHEHGTLDVDTVVDRARSIDAERRAR
jgi:hypothetical protein